VTTLDAIEALVLAALDTIEAAFRKSLTPEQVRLQVFGDPKAVA